MSNAENDGLAQVVLAEGFCTRAQIDRCLQIQSRTTEHLSLGQSLLREGFLTSDQYSRVLVLLRQGHKKERDAAAAGEAERRLAKGRASARQRHEDRVLARILGVEGLVNPGLLKECLEEVAKSARPLAEILVARGYIAPARINAILGQLERRALTCPSCGTTVSVVRLPTSTPMRCPRCRTVLAEVAR